MQNMQSFKSLILGLIEFYWFFRTSILASVGATFCSIPHESYSL
jgi:hypothetical protein